MVNNKEELKTKILLQKDVSNILCIIRLDDVVLIHIINMTNSRNLIGIVLSCLNEWLVSLNRIIYIHALHVISFVY